LNLDQIGAKYGTDKANLGFCRVYARLFEPMRHEPVALLELGVYKGASLRTWAEYFTHPNKVIVGIDLDPGLAGPDLPDRVVTYRGDQTEIPPALKGWRPDIISDDAGHLCAATIASFRTWFPVLKPHGIYAVENVWFSYDPSVGNADPDVACQSGQTTMQFLRRLADEGQTLAIRPEHRLGLDIEWLSFYRDLVVMRRGPWRREEQGWEPL
jgi:hypothetical protein